MNIKSMFRSTALLLTIAVSTPAFAGETKISGKIYADFTSTSQIRAGLKSTQQGINLTRTYLQAKNQLDDVWTVTFKVDSLTDGTVASKNQRVYVKEAQLSGHFSDAANVKIGLIGTPWIGHEEHMFKHRYIVNGYADTQHYDDSADLGLGVYGKVADNMMDYSVAIVNGGGYSHLKTVASQDINARVGFLSNGLTVDLGYRGGYRGTKTKVNNVTSVGTKSTLTQAMVTYGIDNDFRVGGVYAKNKKGTVTTKGYSLWGWMNFNDNFGAFAKYENTKSSTVGSSNEKRSVISLDYNASKNVNISLAYKETKNVKFIAGNKDTQVGVFTQFKF
jgi:hypothetical protein